MTAFPQPNVRRIALAFLSTLAVVPVPVFAADDRAPAQGPGDALQVIADLTLIDGGCRNVVVDFGIGFRFAALQGLTVSSILPTGSRRDEFVAALARRGESFNHDELCHDVAGNYADALPGSVTGSWSRTSGKP